MLLKLLIYISFSLLLVLTGWFSRFTAKPAKPLYAKPITANLATQRYCKNRKKPQWVVDKVLYLAAISGYGAGKVAELFNQRYGHNGDSVGKTFGVHAAVAFDAYTIQTQQHRAIEFAWVILT